LASEPGSGPANSSLAYGNTPIVNITINTPHGTADDYAIEMNNRINTIRRREGVPTALWTR